MPAATQKDEFVLRKDGTVTIKFDRTTIELGQIRNGQLRELTTEIDEINDRIRQRADEDKFALAETTAWNAEHADEDGFEPKEFTETTIVMVDEYGPWLNKVVETLGTSNAKLPADTAAWPAWLTQGVTIAALLEAWRFNPLVRGDG